MPVILSVMMVVAPLFLLLRRQRHPPLAETVLPVPVPVPAVEPPAAPSGSEAETEAVDGTELSDLIRIGIRALHELRALPLTKDHMRILVTLVVVLMPLVMLVAEPLIAYGTPSLADYLPPWPDEVYYWRQAASFQTVGFNSGYFTYNESPAQVGNYFSWGIFTPIFQGTVAKIFGWSLISLPLLNAVLLTIALAVLVRLTKPNYERLGWLLLVQLIGFPLVIFHLTSMIETMLYAFAGLIAACCYALMTTPKPSLRVGALALVVVAAAALARPSMGMFFIPVCLLMLRRKNVFTIGGALVVAMALWVGAWGAYYLTAAPAFRAVTSVFEALPDVGRALQIAIDNTNLNLRWITLGEPEMILLRAQIVAAFFIILGTAIFARWRVTRRYASPVVTREVLLHFYNLGFIFVLALVLYDFQDWRDFRGLAPHLFFSALLFVAFRRRGWLIALVASALIFLPQLVPYLAGWKGPYLSTDQHAEYVEWQPKLASVLVYDPNAPSPWCNTVLHTGYYYNDPATLLAIPTNIAVSFVSDASTIPIPPKSQYVLIEQAGFEPLKDQFARLQPLLDVPHGTLYFNPDSACRESDSTP